MEWQCRYQPSKLKNSSTRLRAVMCRQWLSWTGAFALFPSMEAVATPCVARSWFKSLRTFQPPTVLQVNNNQTANQRFRSSHNILHHSLSPWTTPCDQSTARDLLCSWPKKQEFSLLTICWNCVPDQLRIIICTINSLWYQYALRGLNSTPYSHHNIPRNSSNGTCCPFPTQRIQPFWRWRRRFAWSKGGPVWGRTQHWHGCWRNLRPEGFSISIWQTCCRHCSSPTRSVSG